LSVAIVSPGDRLRWSIITAGSPEWWLLTD
jgi:hypothetical protein